MDTPSIAIETITPEQAQEWLAHNTKNRSVRSSRVQQYARDMAEGRWKITGEPLIFNGEWLMNGQHRLLACVEAGVPFITAVARGVDASAHAAMDTGAVRSVGDELRWRGETNASLLGAALGIIWRYDSGAMLDPRKLPSRGELIAILDAHPEIRKSVPIASSASSAVRIPGSVLGGCHFLFARETTEEEATAFMYLVRVDGAAPVNSPPALLRRYAVRTYMERMRRPHQSDWMALTIKAFNYWMSGASVRHLRWRRGGTQAEAFPAIAPDAYVGEGDDEFQEDVSSPDS